MLGFYNYTVILTYMSLFSAIFGITFAFEGHTFWAVFCLLLSGFCDMFDGKVARTKKRTKQEDGSLKRDEFGDFRFVPMLKGLGDD